MACSSARSDGRSIFWINVPIGLCAAVLTFRFIPESRAPHARRLDPVGQGLNIVLLASLTYGIIEAPDAGWTSARILVAFVLAAASLVGILAYEPRRHESLLNFRFFRSVPFSAATVIAVAAFSALGGFLFLNTLYLQESRGLSALHAGLDTVPMAIMAMVLAPLSGRIVGHRGPRFPLVMAGGGLAVSAVMLTQITASTSFTWLFVAYFVFGFVFGFMNAPITNTAVSGMPRAQAGVAAGIASTSRQIGQTLGVAVVGALVTSDLHGSLGAELPTASHAAWWTLAGCGVVVLVLGLVSTSAGAQASAQRTALELTPEVLEDGGDRNGNGNGASTADGAVRGGDHSSLQAHGGR